MSQREPTEPYVYQPGRAVTDGVRIYGVAGPGAEAHHGKRYTKEDAEAIVRTLKIDALAGELKGRECPRCGMGMAHFRLKGYQCPRCDCRP